MTRRRSQQGQTLPLVTLILITLMVAAALSVDIGSLTYTNRRLQAAADLAAIDGARSLTGTACDQPAGSSSNQYDHVKDAVLISLTRNRFVVGGTKTLVFDLGAVDRTAANGVPQFVPLVTCAATDFPDAVRVRVGDRTAFSFAAVIGQDGRTTTREAFASRGDALDGEGSFSVGSALATLDSSRSGILNTVLSQSLCRAAPPPPPPCSVGLTAVGYNGLVASQVTLGDLAAQLGFGTTNELLTSNVTVDQLLQATAVVLSQDTIANAAAITALGSISTSVTGSQAIQLGSLVSADLLTGNEAADVALNVFELVTGTAAIANGTSAVSIPSFGVTIPGVTSVTASLSLIEPPITIGERPGATKQTKQLSLTVTPTLNLANVNIAGLPVASITGALPIVIQAGKATGTLTGVRCGDDKGIDTTVAVEAASINAASTLQLSVLGGVASAGLAITGTGASTTVNTTPLSFDFPTEFGSAGTQHLGNTTAGLGNLTYGAVTVTVGVRVAIVTIPVTVTISASALAGILSPVLSQVDTLIVKPLMESLGLDLGAADVTATSLTCGKPRLG